MSNSSTAMHLHLVTDGPRHNYAAAREIATVLLPLFATADTKLFNKGEDLFNPRASDNDIFCIEKGLVGIYTGKEGEVLTPVTYKTSGEVTGYHSLFYLGANGCTARAVVPTMAKALHKDLFLKTVTESTKFRDTLFTLLSIELADYETRMKSLTQKSVRERVAELLIYLSHKIGIPQHDRIEVPNLIRRKELAGFIGTSTEHLVRQLGDLKEQRLVQTEGQSIFILDLAGLKTIAKIKD